MATISITSNEGVLESASAVLEVASTNPDYNQPALRIRQAGRRGGAASIRIDDPNPDIELIETGLTGPIRAPGSSRSPFRPTGSRSMAVTPVIQALRRSSCFSGWRAGGNIGIRTTSQFGRGEGVLAIANATVAPSANPAGGGILYVEDGALKYRGSNGTVTGHRAGMSM